MKMTKHLFPLFLFALLSPLLMNAQQPAMHIKAFGGVNVSSFIEKNDSVSSTAFFGWQGGAGLRVRKGSAFFEFDLMFARYKVDLSVEQDSVEIAEVQFNTFEIPISVGYVPVHGPVVKWYLSTGPSLRFNTRAFVNWPAENARANLDEDTIWRIKPGEFDLPTAVVGWNIGTQVDVAMVNFSAMYTINMSNAVKQSIRTNNHSFQFNVGLLF